MFPPLAEDALYFWLSKLHICKNWMQKSHVENLRVPGGNRSLDLRDPRSTILPPGIWYDTVSVWNKNEIWVTYINNVSSNLTILFDILDFWCQLVVIRLVKTLSKRRMFVSSMKISACWLLHRWIIFNKICWEKRPAKTRPNPRTSFCRRDLKNIQPHLNVIQIYPHPTLLAWEGNVFHWFNKNHWHLRLSRWCQLMHLIFWPHQTRQWPYCAGVPSLDHVRQEEYSWGLAYC